MDGRVAYALSVLLGPESVEGSPVVYGRMPAGPRPKPTVWITPSGFFGTGYGTEESLPRPPLLCIEDVPLLFGVPAVERRGTSLVVGADIVASAYFLLTRYEEWVRGGVRDEHGRFPGRESLPFRAGFLDRPVVDEYATLLREWVRQVGVEFPPPSRRFSVLLTHDVDSIGPNPDLMLAVRSVGRGVLGRRSVRKALYDAAVASGLRRHACDNLDEVIRLDRQLIRRCPSDRARSLYFFMAGGDSPYDGGYRLRDARTTRRLREVSASGAGIGLHASYQAGGDPSCVACERLALEEVTGASIHKNRHHFLRWREPDHGSTISAGGVTWDSTMGYADVAGFRLGVCRPVPLFDPIGQCLMGIEEHPLIVMDCTLNETKYMNLGEEPAFELVCRLADSTCRQQGEFVCLWHNTRLARNDTGYHKRLYARVLGYLRHVMERDPTTMASGA
jgi:hypothetical protein